MLLLERPIIQYFAFMPVHYRFSTKLNVLPFHSVGQDPEVPVCDLLDDGNIGVGVKVTRHLKIAAFVTDPEAREKAQRPRYPYRLLSLRLHLWGVRR